MSVTAARLAAVSRAFTPETAEPDDSSVELRLDDAALIGLAGEYVRLRASQTEADPAAILAIFLAFFGNAIGRSAHYRVGQERHYANLFVLVVGDSAARKGTALTEARRPYELACEALDDPWYRERVCSGLNSGEGLLWKVRDPRGADPGEGDKRLLAVEEEFARVLGNARRDGNSLSPMLREAFDRDTLQNMVKASGGGDEKATGVHLSIVAQVTPVDLNRYLTPEHAGNGFANRFLWVFARRHGELPYPEPPAWDSLKDFADRLSEAIEYGKTAETLDHGAATRELWKAVYPRLSSVGDSMVGCITKRGPVQVHRLALIYALLDQDTTIQQHHLEAALALWRYSTATAERVFGDRLGSPDLDLLLEVLRDAYPNPVSKTEFRHHEQGPWRRSGEHFFRIAICSGFARLQRAETGGRPVESLVFIPPAMRMR